MASLPQPSDQQWDTSVERGFQLAAESADAFSNRDDSPAAGVRAAEPPPAVAMEDVPLVTMNEDGSTTEHTEPSASEEQMQEAVTEQKWLISCTSAPTLTHTLIQMFPHSIQNNLVSHKIDSCIYTNTLVNSFSTPSACGLMLHYDCWADKGLFYCISFALLWTSPERTINDL